MSSRPDGSKNRTALIIGPGAYFGDELVEQLASLVEVVVLVSRTRYSSQNPLKNCGDLIVRHVSADVTDHVAFAQQLNHALADCPPLHFVFYNLKQSMKGAALDISARSFTEMLETNITGALTVIQYVASLPRSDADTSVVISGGGFKDRPDQTRLGLSVSKGGLHTLVLAMAPMLRRRGIHLKTAVIDGVVRDAGPLRPEHVARSLIELATSSRRAVLRVGVHSQNRDNQLSLF